MACGLPFAIAETPQPRRPARAVIVGVVLAVALVAAGAGSYLLHLCNGGLPARDSETYRETARRFYRGLAALDVGLLDDAAAEFTWAAELAPAEPATWANLGLTYARQGAVDAAAGPLSRAQELAPASAEIALLQGLLAGAEGRVEEGLAHLRRAVDLGPDGARSRFALAAATERAGGPDADRHAQQQLDAILLRRENLAVRLEQGRLAAKRGDGPALRAAVVRLGAQAEDWPPLAAEQYVALQDATAVGDFRRAATTLAVLRNVLVRVPAFRASLAAVQVPPELMGEPFDGFLALPAAGATAAPPDGALTFSPAPLEPDGGLPPTALLALPPDAGGTPAVFAATGRAVWRPGAREAALPFPGGAGGAPPAGRGLLALDWNHDFRTDLVVAGAGGLRLLLQGPDGMFAAAADGPEVQELAGVDCSGAWAADVEMDGDLDIVAGVDDGAVVVLRNNGDGTWLRTQPFGSVVGVRDFAWGDLDRDGDPDAALLDAGGGLHLFANRQAGQFRPWQAPDDLPIVLALTLGDVDADGRLDLVVLAENGGIWRVSAGDGAWERERLVEWRDALGGGVAGSRRLLLADLDNNGALDLIGSGPSGTGVWLADAHRVLQPLPAAPAAEVFGAADANGDGRLDLLGLDAGRPVWLYGRGERAYHWQVVRPRAQVEAGDQRVNSFGVGGEVEIRAGLLVQKQVLTGAPAHFGLGAHAAADVVRIVWPNGVGQAEFDPPADGVLVTEQRLKGSCPWVFTYDGEGYRFVTDFIWRSPLGLRINAQDTAEVSQTEDWVKIRGDQLAARDGAYDVRITAELWETHFFDHVSLLVVDHPRGVEIFVDERFSREAPVLAIQATQPPRPVARAWDDAGLDVTDIVGRRDGRYLATFERGAYQGVAGDHFVEFELGEQVSADGPVWLIGHGWVYPTDSSINVALGQRGGPVPQGLALEVREASGNWKAVYPDLGFPAGKNKTIVVDLRPALAAAPKPRLRLRTNLEVYWDWLGYAPGAPAAALDTTRLAPATAELCYRGFSRTTFEGPRRLELPHYDRLANVAQRWRDLVGYHTRFGDVRELLAGVDDRYVIMNAGDELQLRFPAPPPPPDGYARDFVLIGDGWVKDGDYNTTFSKTVRPLPSHDRPAYGAAADVAALEDDPVYRQYPDDWQRYHTRFVTPGRFLGGAATDLP